MYDKNVTEQHNVSTVKNLVNSEMGREFFIAIGSGSGALIIVIIITVLMFKRNKLERKRRLYEDTKNKQTKDVDGELEYDGLKDNLLYISSDQPIEVEGDYSVVDNAIPMAADDRNENHTVSGTNGMKTDYEKSNNQSTQSIPTRKADFQNKAFELSDETIEHINAGEGSNSEYAVVNKKKATDVYAVVNKHIDHT